MKIVADWVYSAFEIIMNSNKLYIAAALFVYLFSTFIYAGRTFIILRQLGVKAKYRITYIAYLLNMLVNNITPGARAGGEVVRAAYIARECNIGIATAINIIAFERATEAFAIFILILFTLTYGIFDKRNSEYLFIIAILIIVSLYLVYRYWDRLISWLLEKLEKRGYVKGASEDITRFHELFDNYVLLAASVLLGVAVWLLDALRLYFIGLSLGTTMGFIFYIGVSVLYAGIGVVAVTPGGLGIVESGLTAALIALGAPADDALAITLIERLVSYGLGTLLGFMGLLAAGGMKAWRALRSQ